MKKGTFALVLLLLGCGACSPDSLVNAFETEPQNWNSTGTGSSDTTTVTPVFDDTVLAGDSISGTIFDRTIRIVFADEGAQVTGDVNNIVSVNGNHVTVNNTTDEKVIYELTGSAQDGALKLYSSKKQALVLNGVSLTNTTGAAINNQGYRRVTHLEKLLNNSKCSGHPFL